MAISFLALSFRHERRVRLVFSNTLGAAAFTSTSYYSVTSQNGYGASPLVVAALVVSDASNIVELQLSLDLVGGGVYQFRADGVPAVDTSVTPVDSLLVGTFGEPTRIAVQGPVTETERLLYGIDLQYEGTDFVEGPDGDLAHLSGPALVRRDIWHRVLADGLPWEPAFGVKARGWIDGAPGAVVTLRGRTADQVLEDDRVAGVDVQVSEDEDTGEASVVITPTLIGDAMASKVEPITQSFQST